MCCLPTFLYDIGTIDVLPRLLVDLVSQLYVKITLRVGTYAVSTCYFMIIHLLHYKVYNIFMVIVTHECA